MDRPTKRILALAIGSSIPWVVAALLVLLSVYVLKFVPWRC